MRKFFLCLPLLFCTLVSIAQNNTNGLVWEMAQPADNIVSLWWRYEVTESEYDQVTYYVYRIEYTGQDHSERNEILVRTMPAKQTLGNESIVLKEFETRLVDLDLTGNYTKKGRIMLLPRTEPLFII